ncbi:MAG TPA: hypothetical protein VEJ87_03980, partial [Acidimicrobiales bacterium]|nr:hypothetical protein [Acidimicrobiales bacterium]
MSDAVPSGIRVSPLTPEILAEGRISISGLQVVGRRVWWSESRPTERGRQVVLRADLSSTGESWRHDHRLATPADSSASPTDAATAFADLATASTEPEEVTPTETSVRSRVHEYGGGAF